MEKWKKIHEDLRLWQGGLWSLSSSGIWRLEGWCKFTDVWNESAASFMVNVGVCFSEKLKSLPEYKTSDRRNGSLQYSGHEVTASADCSFDVSEVWLKPVTSEARSRRRNKTHRTLPVNVLWKWHFSKILNPLNIETTLNYISRFNSCRAVNTLLFGCKSQSVNSVQRISLCFVLRTKQSTLMNFINKGIPRQA